MKSVLLAVMLMITFPLWSLYGSTHVTIRVTGGGTGTFADGKIDPWDIDDLDGDLDGDGDIDGSQFGMGVIMFADGSAQGHFECLMAGASDILGLPLMAVEGQGTQGTVNVDGSVTFSGVSRVNLANGQIFTDVPFEVTLTPGGRGVGTFQLTVIGVFDGVPGDTAPGNGNYDLPVETVASGRIKVH